jgi:hypothetical protein
MMPIKQTPLVLGDESLASAQSQPSYGDLKEAVADINHFSSSSSSKSLSTDLSLEKRKDKFAVKMQSVLDKIQRLNINDEQLEAVFVLVLQSAEDYLYCKDKIKCEAMKHDICIRLLKQFTKDDPILCKQLIKFVQHRIKVTTAWRRHKKSVKTFFLRLWSSLVGLF